MKEVLEIGVLLDVAPDVEAFVHISELDDRYIPDARKLFKAGDLMDVKVLRPNDRGGIRASRRAPGSWEPPPPGWNPDPKPGHMQRCRRERRGARELGRVPRRARTRPGGLGTVRTVLLCTDRVGAAHPSGLGQLCTDERWRRKAAEALLFNACSELLNRPAALTALVCCCRKALLGRSPAPPPPPPMKAPPRPKVVNF